ncbi:hypothetical protein KPL40_19615 [Clostridium gasigenes]|uniref:hypothetical protein n=1 Tax=Clostridium gasigenes TaxID=94869 RepID=UPI001C0D84A4|nr:hypothetical protein [Clostridium gasigenes]MBU3134613.1 hypothetical protein [Clostridium gasigenes]
MYNCECGCNLMFVRELEVIDKYDDKILVECEFECPNCSNEYTINVESKNPNL